MATRPRRRARSLIIHSWKDELHESLIQGVPSPVPVPVPVPLPVPAPLPVPESRVLPGKEGAEDRLVSSKLPEVSDVPPMLPELDPGALAPTRESTSELVPP